MHPSVENSNILRLPLPHHTRGRSPIIITVRHSTADSRQPTAIRPAPTISPPRRGGDSEGEDKERGTNPYSFLPPAPSAPSAPSSPPAAASQFTFQSPSSVLTLMALHAYVNLFEATTHGQRRVDQPASLEHRGGAKSRITRTTKRRQKATNRFRDQDKREGGNGNGNTTVRDKLLRLKPNRESGLLA